MTSRRLSARVVQPAKDDLGNGPFGATNGEEASRSSASFPRIGRRQLDRIVAGLSDRDRAVLTSLQACHYATTTQLERLWFQGTDLTPLSAARTSRRALARLHQLGLLTHLERRVGGVRAGSASFVWTLTSLGHRALGDSSRRRAHEPTVRHLDHVLAVTELVVRIHEAARDGVVQLIGIETEPTCWRTIPTPHGGRDILKPDLRVTLGIGEFELHWWIEVDRATEHRPTLRRKAEVYLRAWRDGSEEKRAGVTPRVLWVTPNETRRQVLAELLTTSSAPGGLFVTATEPDAVEVLRGVRS